MSTAALAEVVTDSKTEYTFTLVPTGHVPYLWATAADLLRPAVERSHGRWTMDNLFSALYAGHQQLWVGYIEKDDIKFAITTEVADYPNARYLAIHFLGGTDFNSWSDDMLAMLERFAKDQSCCGVEAVARFGFWPLFKRRGYQRSYVTYELFF